jgi:hypothetical protein
MDSNSQTGDAGASENSTSNTARENPTLLVPETQLAEASNIFTKAALPVAVVAFGLALASIVLALNQPKAPLLGVIDLGGVMQVKEQQFTAMLTKPNITEADRASAFDLVKAVGSQVEGGIRAVRDECKCILLVKGAVITVDHPALTDYTPLLKAKLGMDK